MKTSARRAPIFSPATLHSGKEAAGKQKPNAERYKATVSPFPHELLVLNSMDWHCFLSLITGGGGVFCPLKTPFNFQKKETLLIKKA